MDTLYSVSLLASLLSGALAIACSFAIRWPQLHRRLPWNRAHLRRGLLTSIIASYAALAVSLGVHLNWGHSPGSGDALSFAGFFRIHPSFLIAAVMPMIAVLLAGRKS